LTHRKNGFPFGRLEKNSSTSGPVISRRLSTLRKSKRLRIVARPCF